MYRPGSYKEAGIFILNIAQSAIYIILRHEKFRLIATFLTFSPFIFLQKWEKRKEGGRTVLSSFIIHKEPGCTRGHFPVFDPESGLCRQ
jgi:hypothetical protein